MWLKSSGITAAVIWFFLISFIGFIGVLGGFGRMPRRLTKGEGKENKLYMIEYRVQRKIAENIPVQDIRIRDPYSDDHVKVFIGSNKSIWIQTTGRDGDWEESFVPYDATNGTVSDGDYYALVWSN